MFKYIFILQIFLSSFISPNATSQYLEISTLERPDINVTQTVISYAQEYRTDINLSAEDEEDRLNKILKKTSEILPRYVVNDDLKTEVKKFIVDTLSIEISDATDLIVIDTRTTEFFGKSQDTVFIVQDRNNDVRYIVKAFQNPCLLSGKFLPEISAINLIQELNLPGVVPILPIAFALCREKENEWGLLLESAAHGQRLDQYIFSVSSTKNHDERQQNMKKAQIGFNRMGETLGLLHSTKASEKQQLHSSILQKYDEKLNKVLKENFIRAELSKYFSLSQLVDYVNKIKEKALQMPLSYTYIHGDPNLGNVFYDEQNDTISLIDLHSMHRSIDANSQPINDSTIDLVWVEDSIRKKAVNFLTDNEVNILIASFYSAYQEKGGIIPEEAHLNFYKTYIALWKLILGGHYIDQEDPIRRDFDKTTFEEGVEYFNDVFNKR